MADTEDDFESVDDMVNMVVLDEASILTNLRDRFKRDCIYTNVGAILISVNPYRTISSLYSKAALKSHQTKDSETAPHIFKVTEAAYRRMLDYETDQSILISGESGAGKTEACKCILQYLAEVSGQGGKIQDQILESNPLMEAFGNAKTVRNNNSSRFGKFIQLKFSRTGTLVGADITKYLLEKSRVVYQAPQERNYHIFYELCAGLSGPQRSALHIGQAEEYRYLNQGKTMTIEGVSDTSQFEITKRAMKTIGIADDKQKEIFQVLAAILHIGNINFEFIKETDSVVVKNEKEVDIAAKLLGIKSSTLNFALCHRDIIVSGQTFKKPLDLKQAVDSRDALAKGLYERLFDWLVDRINKSIASSQDAWHTIGVLDIFGFEFFDNSSLGQSFINGYNEKSHLNNSLEQLCINYCNEKLQLMYNTHVFQQEQKEYQAEGINCDQVEFVDNQPCIDFFEKSLGIMSILDEECKFPQATDRTFLEKLEVNHKTNPVFLKELRANTRFLVRHFAGEVMYDVGGFMDKNRDTLRNELAVLVKKSEVSFVKLLFGDRPVSESLTSSPSSGRSSNTSGAPSVCSQFKHQLNTLMKTLSSTQPHFIRCVKPNVLKLPDIFDEKLVSAQLRYTGVLGTIKIRQAGFPVRFSFAEFVHRYSLLGFKNSKKQKFASTRDEASALATALKLGNYQIGKTKIFFKSPRAFDELELQRKNQLARAAATIQSLYRGRKQYRRYQKIKKVAIAFQTAARAMHAHRQLLHLKEERTRRIREEQAQRDKEQKLKEEQMRKERELKQKEKEEKEREIREQKAKQDEEVAQRMNAKRYKYKYKHCTCGAPREDEKENFNPNKTHGMQVLSDLLTQYGASSIGNIYEDGRTIHVELFLYKYEFLNKLESTSKVPTTGLVPKKVGPSASIPPKPPTAPSKTGLVKALAKFGASAPAKEPAREGGRGATGVRPGILSKVAQFQAKSPSSEPDPPHSSPTRATSPRATSPRAISPRAVSPRATSPHAATEPEPVFPRAPSLAAPPPPVAPPKKTVVLPPAPKRAVVHSPGTLRGNYPEETDQEERFPTFQELRAMMSKKLPALLFNLSGALQTQNLEEEATPASQMGIWEHFRNTVSPPPPVEPQLLGSLTKERAKPPPQRRARSKPAKGNKAPPAQKVTENVRPLSTATPNPSAPLSAPPSARPATAPAASFSPPPPSLSSPPPPSSTSSPTPPLSSTSSPSPSPSSSTSSIPSSTSSATARPSPATSPSSSTSTTPSPSHQASTPSRPRTPSQSASPSLVSSPSSTKTRPPVPTTRPQRPLSQENTLTPPQPHLASRASSPSQMHSPTPAPIPTAVFSLSPSSPLSPSSSLSPSPSPPHKPAPRPHSQPTPVVMAGKTQMPSASTSLISSKSSRRYGGVLPHIPSEETDLQEETDLRGETEIFIEPGMAPKNVMGVDPSTLTYATDLGFKVPNFLGPLRILLTKNNGIEREGIFRMAGREDTITKLGHDISDGVSSLECDDPLSVAAFMKRWYSRLPLKLFNQLSNDDIESMYNSPGKVKTILKAKMTENYYNMFWWLMAFMVEVAGKVELNKMGAKNLATLLGPIVLELGPDMADLQRNQKVVCILQHILEYSVSG